MDGSAGELDYLNVQVKVQSAALEAEEQQSSTLYHKLRETRRQTALCQEQQQEAEVKLAKTQMELQCSLQLDRDRRARLEQTYLKEMPGPHPLERVSSPLLPPALDLPSRQRDLTFPDPIKSSPGLPLGLSQPSTFLPGPSDRDLDKIARNIDRFVPDHKGTQNTRSYLVF